MEESKGGYRVIKAGNIVVGMKLFLFKKFIPEVTAITESSKPGCINIVMGATSLDDVNKNDLLWRRNEV